MIENFELSEKERFVAYLLRKELMDNSINKYLEYYDKLKKIMDLLQMDISEEIVNEYLAYYNTQPAKSFLKNYLKFRKIKDIEIVSVTGSRKKKKKIVEPISKENQELLRQAFYLKNNQYGMMFDLTIGCALRRSEILNLQGEDITASDGKIFLCIKNSKRNKTRMVYVPREIGKRLIKYLQLKQPQNKDYIFPALTNSNKRMHEHQFKVELRNLSNKLFDKNYFPHQLRMTKATEWFEEGVDVTRIKTRLGHENISTTMLYIKPDEKKELELWSNEE